MKIRFTRTDDNSVVDSEIVLDVDKNGIRLIIDNVEVAELMDKERMQAYLLGTFNESFDAKISELNIEKSLEDIKSELLATFDEFSNTVNSKISTLHKTEQFSNEMTEIARVIVDQSLENLQKDKNFATVEHVEVSIDNALAFLKSETVDLGIIKESESESETESE